MKKIVVLSGAGISAESGLSTFRDHGGLWDQYPVEEVATPEAFERNPALVLEFYNLRRKLVLEAAPNAAHLALSRLEDCFDVEIITQNIDDLHERAGSTRVCHLHGEVMQARSAKNPSLMYDVRGQDLSLGDLAEDGAQLRPDVVWFGEAVPMMEEAIYLVDEADILIVVGTSLNVYPAASLVDYTSPDCQGYVIDPSPSMHLPPHFTHIEEKATVALPAFCNQLLNAL